MKREFSSSSEMKKAKHECHKHEWINQITEAPVYRPLMEDFHEPLEFLHKIAPEASKYGICKIVSPLVPTIPAGVVMKKEKTGFRFTPKLQRLRIDKNTFFTSSKSYSVGGFEAMANKVSAKKYGLSGCSPCAYLETQFWHEITCCRKATVQYGVNIDSTAFSSSFQDQLANSKWNLKRLARLPRSVLSFLEKDIPGVTDPMLYIGMLFSMFAWHVEDHYLYSINYHHCGAPKTWYGVPGDAALELEKVVKNNVYAKEMMSIDDLLSEKTTMFAPKILLENQIPVYKVVQLPGEFVITFPQAYHAGFSHGFNCGEAVNFALNDWFPFGEAANTRYAILRKTPVVPYEEILCKTTMQLSSKTCDYFVKVSFANLILKHDDALLSLKKLDKSFRVSSSNSKGTICCSLCKRGCYIAHVNCYCHADPICVFHEMELSNCCCGSKRVVYVRRDFHEMVDLAKKFEEQMKLNDCFYKDYRLFCKDGLNEIEDDDKKIQPSKLHISDGNNASPCANGNMKRRKAKSSSSNLSKGMSSRRLKMLKRTCRTSSLQCYGCCANSRH